MSKALLPDVLGCARVSTGGQDVAGQTMRLTPMETVMFTCFIRYTIESDRLDEFRGYAHSWISLIRKYGGTHHGYFISGTAEDNLPSAAFSFPGLGAEGPPNIAVALFSFPSIEAYNQYRLAVSDDEACKAATARFNETKCFSSYERTFLVPMFE
jgi:hypothetical protein